MCACVVQLESDEDLLVPHARAALEKYRHQVSVQGVRVGKQVKPVFFPMSTGSRGQPAAEPAHCGYRGNRGGGGEGGEGEREGHRDDTSGQNRYTAHTLYG